MLPLAPRTALAQTAIIEGAAGAGTGASFGTGNGATVVLMSPVFVDVDVIFSTDEFPKLEYAVALQAEVQGRVSAGIIPQLRLNNGSGKLSLYGLVGVPFFLAPFTMLGVEAGAGVVWRMTETLGLYGEALLDLFIIGNDLQKDGILVRLDGCVGLRVRF